MVATVGQTDNKCNDRPPAADLLMVLVPDAASYGAALVQKGFPTLADNKLQMPSSVSSAVSPCAASNLITPHSRCQRATARTSAASGAADMAVAARLKALQKTPFPMVIARMKVLLERLHSLAYKARPTTASATLHCHPKSREFMASLSDGYTSSMLFTSVNPQPCLRISSKGAATLAQSYGCKTPPRGTSASGSANISGSKGAKGMSSSSGGAAESVAVQLSVQAVLQELEVIFGFMSEFLDKVPRDTRLALATVARLESYKKDQIIYDIGQQATNFYIILSGRIDIWSHPPGCTRPKTTVSVLRKGDTFGDQAIINKARHSTAASPGCNASLLVVSKEDFLTVFGPYFQGVAASWTDFLLSHVAPIKAAQLPEVQQLCSAMVSSKPPPNKEFDLQQDQVFFVKEGTFELQLIDLEAQKAADAAFASVVAATSAIAATRAETTHPQSSSDRGSKGGAADIPNTSELNALDKSATAAGLMLTGGNFKPLHSSSPGTCVDLPTLGTHGVLASVRVEDGKALGTLGYERELRRQQHASVPRKTVAVLGPGSWFGGGNAIYGSGPIQSALRVVAKGPGPLELIYLPLEGIEQHGGESLIRRLRDDAAFTRTYHLGRLGLLPVGTAVGHPQASLLSVTELTTVAMAAAPSALMGQSASAIWGGRSTSSMPGTPRQATIAPAVMEPHASRTAAALTYCVAASASQNAVPGPILRDIGHSFKVGQAAAASADTTAVAALVGTSTLRRNGRQRQKNVHVAGSGVYSPGVMAALQHVQSLQADFAAHNKMAPAKYAQQQQQQPATDTAAGAGPSSIGIAAVQPGQALQMLRSS